MTTAVQIALITGLTTVGTAIVNGLQTVILEVIRRRRTAQAHDDIAEKVAQKLGPPFSDDRNASGGAEIKE